MDDSDGGVTVGGPLRRAIRRVECVCYTSANFAFFTIMPSNVLTLKPGSN